jgi:[ribosomal protein S18]-alanine N-acetyltransferase
MASAPELFAACADVTTRPMRAGDVAEVVTIERAAYQFPWSEGIFRDCLRVGYVCTVVVAGAEVVGYGVMSVGAGEAHVLNLCIAEGHRCRGAGRQLLQDLLRCASSAGAAEAFLEVRPSNTTAIRLYLALGFEQVGMRRGYYQAVNGREDAAVLKLALSGYPAAPGQGGGVS